MRLIDADALRKCFEVPHELKCGIQAGMDEYALKCIDEQPTITYSPWRRVEDELPKEDGKYVAINVKTKWWYEASYENGNWKAVDLFGQRWVVIHPTHWMPLPEPPKEDNT